MQHLVGIFSNFGAVLDCCIQQHPEHGGKEALVRMDSIITASQAMAALESYAVRDYHNSPHCLPMRMQYFNWTGHGLKPVQPVISSVSDTG